MLFPVKDYNPTERTAYVTVILIVLNIMVFAYQSLFSNLHVEIGKYALIPYEVSHLKTIDKPVAYRITNRGGENYREYIFRSSPFWKTLFFSLFMHGSLMHLLGNMLFLWIFGNNIEDRLGKIKFVFFYFICGIGASLFHILFNLNSMTPVIGASGAVSGVMGAYLILFPHARIRSLVFIFIFITFVDIPAFVFLVIWFIFQFINLGGEGIAWIAHVGGFMIGLLLIRRWKKSRDRVQVEILQ